MRKIDLTPFNFKLASDSAAKEADPVLINPADIMMRCLQFAALKGGKDVTAPFYEIAETVDELMRVQKVMRRLGSELEEEDGKTVLMLSDEQWELAKKVCRANPYITTIQTVIIERLDDAEEVESA